MPTVISKSAFFTLQPFNWKTKDAQKELSKREKIFVITLSIFIGFLTFGLGGLFTLLAVSKVLRDRHIKIENKDQEFIEKLNQMEDFTSI